MSNNPDPENLEHFTTSISGYEIFALRAKNGAGKKPIVMIHGAIASRRYMIPTAKLLAGNFDVVLPDLPGHGASSKPEHALTVKQHAAVLNQWIQAIGFERVNLLANSYGCQIAAQVAATYPEIVDRLILTDPTGDPSAPRLTQQFIRLTLNGFVEPLGAPLMMFKDIYDLGIRRTFETAHRMKEDDIRDSLPLVKAKTLVIRGANDFISPQEWCEEVMRLLPDAQLIVIQDAPHSVTSATPKTLTALVTEFLVK